MSEKITEVIIQEGGNSAYLLTKNGEPIDGVIHCDGSAQDIENRSKAQKVANEYLALKKSEDTEPGKGKEGSYDAPKVTVREGMGAFGLSDGGPDGGLLISYDDDPKVTETIISHGGLPPIQKECNANKSTPKGR